MEEIRFNNLDECSSYRGLAEKREYIDLASLLTPERIEKYSIPLASGLTYNYASKLVDDDIIDELARIAKEQQVLPKYRMIIDGKIMNPGEQRKVLHHLQRGILGEAVTFEGRNLGTFYEEQHRRVSDFAEKVHSGEIKGSRVKNSTQQCR